MVVLSESLDARLRGGQEGACRVGESGMRLADPCHIAGWNSLCESHPDGSFFHTTEWLNVLAATYGFSPLSLISGDEAQPRMMLPLMEIAQLGMRKGVSLPFTDFCEPLLWGSDTGDRPLWNELLQAGKARGWKRLEIRGGSALAGNPPASLEFYGHVLDLEPGEDKLFAAFEPGVRQAIRKAEREGVKVEISTAPEAMMEYYYLHCQTRKRQGLPPQPWRLFRKIHEYVIGKGKGLLVMAMHDEAPVAGAVFVQFGRKGVFKYGASDRRVQHLRANDLVMWTAIRELARNGADSLHFGRTSVSNEGLRRFKLRWRPEEYKIQYLTYDFRQSAFVRSRDRAYGWHNRLFGAMPVWVARIAGSLLYRRFA
jgi:hypothetical protein